MTNSTVIAHPITIKQGAVVAPAYISLNNEVRSLQTCGVAVDLPNSQPTKVEEKYMKHCTPHLLSMLSVLSLTLTAWFYTRQNNINQIVLSMIVLPLSQTSSMDHDIVITIFFSDVPTTKVLL